MTEAKSKLNLHQRILAITDEVEAVKKEKKKQGMHYDYVSHDAVTNALRDLMIKHGVSHEPSVEEWRHDGNRCEMKVAVTFINVDFQTDRFTVCGVGYGIDNQDKGPGKAESYAVKTIMLKQFMLETGEPDVDADQKTKHKTSDKDEKTTAGRRRITEPQRVRLKTIATKRSWPNTAVSSLLGTYGYESSTEILWKDYENIIKELDVDFDIPM